MSAFAAALGLRRASTALAEPAELQQLLDSVSQPRVDSVVIKADWQSGGTGGKRQVGAADLDAASAAGSNAAQGQQQHAPPGLPAAAAGPRASTPGAQAASTSSSSPHWLLTSVYGVTNLSSGAGQRGRGTPGGIRHACHSRLRRRRAPQPRCDAAPHGRSTARGTSPCGACTPPRSTSEQPHTCAARRWPAPPTLPLPGPTPSPQLL